MISRTNSRPNTLFITCAALGREVKAIIRKHGWDADIQAIDAKNHLYPTNIEREVEARLEQTDGQYQRRVVVYGHCGAHNLKAILEAHGAVQPEGPHCYEMFGGEHFYAAIKEEPGTYFLTDFLVRAWDKLVVKGLQLDRHPSLLNTMFRHYRRIIYYSQEQDPKLLAKANDIAQQLNLSLEVEHVGYGELERRLIAIMERPLPPPATPKQGKQYFRNLRESRTESTMSRSLDAAT